jgi:ribosomal-protein-alanine N-acetyltransferase
MSARVELRDFEPGDADAVHRWFNDRDATEGLLEQRESFSQREAADWVDRALDTGGEDRKWAVLAEGGDGPCGFVALYGLGRQIAPELGVLIADPRARGRGVGREAIRRAAARAFELGAHRVYARILARNDASRRAFEAVGFQREGVMRSHVRRGDDLLDVELWGLLPDRLVAEDG